MSDWDHERWVRAWGGNKPTICNGVNDDYIPLPALGTTWDWLLVRETTPGKDQDFPTYRLVLMHDTEGEGFVRVASRKIDKQMYGEAGVIETARLMKEKHCPITRTSSTSAPMAPTGRLVSSAPLKTP